MKKLLFIILAVFLLALYSVDRHGGSIAAVLPLTVISFLPACAALFPIIRILDLLSASKEDSKNTKEESKEQKHRTVNDQDDDDLFTSMFSFD